MKNLIVEIPYNKKLCIDSDHAPAFMAAMRGATLVEIGHANDAPIFEVSPETELQMYFTGKEVVSYAEQKELSALDADSQGIGDPV